MAQLKNLIVEGDSRLIGDTNAGKITASSIVKSGGTSSQFLKADGSVDGNAYLTSHQSIKTINSNTMTGTGNVSVGTITGITMNGSSVATSGVANLGNVAIKNDFEGDGYVIVVDGFVSANYGDSYGLPGAGLTTDYTLASTSDIPASPGVYNLTTNVDIANGNIIFSASGTTQVTPTLSTFYECYMKSIGGWKSSMTSKTNQQMTNELAYLLMNCAIIRSNSGATSNTKYTLATFACTKSGSDFSSISYRVNSVTSSRIEITASNGSVTIYCS